ncbi:macrophage mannose receptor 1-like [Saccostrea echinata]|uniref:macrophage mannose receptor 1-like n=1 Tax=Saccostrea echinata TaxID=191078 RepID=UPI002A820F36|nr:macrophage mannose receptor 1-like [Saccostrea echinata]
MDADLLKINDAKEQTVILDILKKKDAQLPGVQEWWVGMKREKNDINQWTWTDSSSANHSYIRWGIDEPNNYNQNEHCGEIWESTFNDKNCDSKLNFVCERPKDQPVRCSVEDGYSYHNKKCYKFYNNQLKRSEALSACAGEFAQLVTIETEEDQHAVTELAYSYQSNVWLGIKFMNKVSQWLVINSPNWEQPANMFFWQTDDNFNNSIENCAALNVSAKDNVNNWYIENCTLTNAFICQKPAGVCSRGFEQYEEKCFLFKENMKQSWNQAKHYCEGFESNLLEIESDGEQNYISTKLQKRRVIPRLWIGIKSKHTGMTNGSLSMDKANYYWEMSKGTRTPAYLNVRATGTASACGYIDPGRSGGWYFDLPCNTPLPFICYSDVMNGNVQPRQFTTFTTPTTTTTIQTTHRALIPVIPVTKKTSVIVQPTSTVTKQIVTTTDKLDYCH